MVRSRIIKVEGALGESKPQNFGVEVKISLGIRSNRCYVMETDDGL
jgi:hypothetical protein